MPIKKLTFALYLFSLFIFSACASQKNEMAPTQVENHDLKESVKKAEACVCIKMYMPVCGKNGKTYGNTCEAKCAGVTEFSAGECHKLK